jgi:hypothetical protein
MTEIKKFQNKIIEWLDADSIEGTESAVLLLLIARDRFSLDDLNTHEFADLARRWYSSLDCDIMEHDRMAAEFAPLLRFDYPEVNWPKNIEHCLTPFEQEIVSKIRNHLDEGGPYEMGLASGLLLVHPLPECSEDMPTIFHRLRGRFWKCLSRMGSAKLEMNVAMLELLREIHG